MRSIYFTVFAIASIVLTATGDITPRDVYIGMNIFLAAEYIKCAIERKK